MTDLQYLDGEQVFTGSLTPLTTETYTFDLKFSSRFRAVLSNLSADADLTLKTAQGTTLAVSTNPDQASEALTQILAPGTYTLTVSAERAPSNAQTPYKLALTAAEARLGSQISWRNRFSDQTATWELAQNQLTGSGYIQQAPTVGSNSPWKLIQSVEADAGKRLLVWRNEADDQTGIWTVSADNTFIEGSVITNAPVIGANSNWKLISANQVNGNLTLLWRDAVADATGYWTVNSAKQFTGGGVFQAPVLGSNSDWKLVGSLHGSTLGNDSTQTQLIWRNAVSDETAYWNISTAGQFVNGAFFSAPQVGRNSDWKLVSVSQVEGNPEMIWHNAVSGEAATWLFNGSDFFAGSILNAPKVGGDWQVVGVTSRVLTSSLLSIGSQTLDTALQLGNFIQPVTYRDKIAAGGVNYYALTLTASSDLTFAIDNRPGLTAQVVDQNGRAVDPSSALAPGAYYFQVTNASGSAHSYAFSLDPNRFVFKQFGTSADDYGNSVAVDGDGNVYVVGNTFGQFGDSSTDSSDIFLARYDSLGNQTWIKQFGTSSYDEAFGVAVDSTGKVYVTGHTEGQFGDSIAGDFDIFLAQYDSLGNQIWLKQFGTSDYDEASGVAVDSMGKVYVTGYTDEQLGDASAGGYDGFLAQYDSLGNQIWIKQFGTSSDDYASGVAVNSTGKVYVTGYTDEQLGDASAGGYDGFLVQYDSLGNQIWIKQFGSNSDDFADSVTVDSTGKVYVTGETYGQLGDASAGGYDGFLAQYDSLGNQIWIKQFGSNSDDVGTSVAVDSRGEVYVTGITAGQLGDLRTNSRDIFLAQYDSLGNQTRIKQFGSITYDGGLSVAVDSTGKFYVTGRTDGQLGDASAGESDVFLLTYDSRPL